MHSVRRKCPRCGGLFYLDEGVALCPHCGRAVKPTGGDQSHQALWMAYAQVLAEKAAFWAEEAAALAEEFGEAAVERLKGELEGR